MAFTKEFRESNKQITVWVDRELADRIKDILHEQGWTMSEVVRKAIMDTLDNPPKKRRLGYK